MAIPKRRLATCLLIELKRKLYIKYVKAWLTIIAVGHAESNLQIARFSRSFSVTFFMYFSILPTTKIKKDRYNKKKLKLVKTKTKKQVSRYIQNLAKHLT